MILHIKDIEKNVFFSEDRNDWLSAQRRREAGKRFTGAAADVRQSHREHCDAEEVAREHHNDCAAQQVARSSRTGAQQQNRSDGPTLIRVLAIIIGILVAVSTIIALIRSFLFNHYANDMTSFDSGSLIFDDNFDF